MILEYFGDELIIMQWATLCLRDRGQTPCLSEEVFILWRREKGRDRCLLH